MALYAGSSHEGRLAEHFRIPGVGFSGKMNVDRRMMES